jgi:predicted nucleotidyltransferase
MKTSGLSENERIALAKLKKALEGRFNVIDFRVFGSKARGEATPESDIDVMIEVEDYNPAVESGIDDLIFSINVEFDCFISAVIFGRKELEEGPLGESPLYRVIAKEGVAV